MTPRRAPHLRLLQGGTTTPPTTPTLRAGRALLVGLLELALETYSPDSLMTEMLRHRVTALVFALRRARWADDDRDLQAMLEEVAA